MPRSIGIFLCYAREDEELRQGLEKHLRVLKRQGIINIWHDRNIGAGTEWENEIDNHLKTARLILLLVSPDFLDSDYCYSKEMTQAMERHERGGALVIPIILRHVYWLKTPFGKLQALPRDGKPVLSSAWYNQDEALFNASEGIRIAVENLAVEEDAKLCVAKGNIFYEQRQYEQAIEAYEQALQYKPQYLQAYHKKGDALVALARYEDAIATLDEALHISEDLQIGSNRIEIRKSLGQALIFLNRYEEALHVYERALRPNFDNADLNKRINDLRDILKGKEALSY